MATIKAQSDAERSLVSFLELLITPENINKFEYEYMEVLGYGKKKS